MSHTPGPWHVGPEYIGGWPVYLPDGRLFCVVQRGRGIPAEAYARLVAAAPELLAACKALLPEGWGDDDTMDHMPGVKLARQAIAKAENRS